MVQAMIAPSTPVSTPNRRGSRKTPEPIIEPTTIEVSVGRLTFSVTFQAVPLPSRTADSLIVARSLCDGAVGRIADSRIRLEIGQDLLTLGVVLVVGDRARRAQHLKLL